MSSKSSVSSSEICAIPDFVDMSELARGGHPPQPTRDGFNRDYLVEKRVSGRYVVGSGAWSCLITVGLDWGLFQLVIL